MTLQDLQRRHSVRSYSEQPLSEAEINIIRASISEINSYLPGTRFQFIMNDTTPFDGKLGSYGLFHGVRNYIAAVVDTGVAGYDQIAGYAGQKVVMAATMHGLGTCFIGGSFSSKNLPVQTRVGEVVRFIISVGHPLDSQRFLAKMMMSFAHRKKMVSTDFFDAEKSALAIDEIKRKYADFEQALEAVACAPSAMNARPVRIWADADGQLWAGTVKSSEFSQVDLGIAQFNFEQIIPGEFSHLSPAPFFSFSE